MGNKIIVKFDRKELKHKCKTLQQYPNNWCYTGCEKRDEDLIDCVMRRGISCEYNIKE